MIKIKTDVYSRVSGYYSPINKWNAAKREEASERKMLNIEQFLEDKRGKNDLY